MDPTRRAVIDVGTNSVKLLVADVAGQNVLPIWEESSQTRLGRGFYPNRRLQSEAIKATAIAVAGFADKARERQASSVRVIATSAAREAINSEELTRAIQEASALNVEIISGEQEADWAFQGVTSDPALEGRKLLLLDVGGGSTEFILGQDDHKQFRASFPLGTVRLMETLPHSDPPTPQQLAVGRQWLRDFLEKEVKGPLLLAKEALPSEGAGKSGAGEPADVWLVGTGGTTSILARMESQLDSYDRSRIEATRLSLDRLRWHVEHLWSLPFAQRRQIVGLPPSRADVILMGVVIYEAVMEHFGFSELRISTRGLRFAAVMEPLER